MPAQEIPEPSALAHPGLSSTTIRALWVTLLFALAAGGLETLYLFQQETVSAFEWASLAGVSLLLASILAALMIFPGKYIGQLAIAAFAGAILYLFSMLIGALFWAAIRPAACTRFYGFIPPSLP